MDESKSCKCDICGESFSSKTKLFKHLSIHGYESKDAKPVKVVVLVGWMSKITECKDIWVNDQMQSSSHTLDETSAEVESALFKALYVWENKLSSTSDLQDESVIDRPKGFSRGSSCLQRTSQVFGSEPTCHGQSDTFAFQIKPLVGVTVEAWVEKMNSFLPETIRIHYAYVLTPGAGSSFHAETECTQRRYEFMLPLRFIMSDESAVLPSEPVVRKKIRHHHSQKHSKLGNMDQSFPLETEEGQIRISFFRKLKIICKALAGKQKFHNFVSAGAATNDASIGRRLDRIYHKEIIRIHDEDWVVFSISGDALLKGQVRKMLGLSIAVALDWVPMDFLEIALNPDLVADVPSIPGWGLYIAECRYACWEAKYTEYRLDPRRVENGDTSMLDNWTEKLQNHIASISEKVGDYWMKQLKVDAVQMYEKLVKVKSLRERSRLSLEQDFEIIFGQEALANVKKAQEEADLLAAAEAEAATLTSTQNEKTANVKKTFKAPNRKSKKPRKGQSQCQVKPDDGNKTEQVNNDGEDDSDDDNSSIASAEMEIMEVVEVEQNEDKGPSGRTGNNPEYREKVMKLTFVEVPAGKEDVPAVFAEVLRLLREADRSQAWPASSTGRQQVIADKTLLEQGGRGGSFSVGALPKHLVQPKGNVIFPDLMRACFRLEKALMPNRPPSATIAINRHAQFLPHRDSGAGAGQTNSLIVALGAFTGGEIVVDNIPHDIRYKPIEFDGWKSLHYTLPFVGERYSLVWFTPLGLSYEDMWWWNDM